MKLNIEKINKINELKALRKLKNKDEYKKLKQQLAKEFGVTLRSIENYLNQPEPGQRKTRSDAGQPRAQISDKEKEITKEILTGGKEIKLAKKIIEDKTGKKVSNRKLNHIRDKIEPEMNIPQTPFNKGESDSIKASTFGDEAKELFERLFELDLIAPNYGIKVKVGDKEILVPKYYVETICLVLADAYNYVENKYKIDPEQLVRKRLFHLIEQHVRIAETVGSTTKDVKELVSMYEDLLEKVKLDADFHVVEKICQDLKAGITISEIIALIKKYSKEVE